MGKGKLEKFAEMETFDNVFQYPFAVLQRKDFPLRGKWHEQYFHNNNPIVLELGCGKGEYTVGLARRFVDTNFIGIDIKGARMHAGAKQAVDEKLTNVAFLRTHIEMIDRFFAPNEVDELWLTFSDPQMKKSRKRLTSTYFLERYRNIMKDRGLIHLKTDSLFLYTYTCLMAEHNNLPVEIMTDDLYKEATADSRAGAKATSPATQLFINATALQTYYERQWLSRGLSIKYMCFCLPQEGMLEETDVEIPMDEYRSYHRDKRSGNDMAK